MVNPDQLAGRNPADDTDSSRIERLYQRLVLLSAVLFLAAFLLTLDQWLFRPVRKLAGVPGVSVLGGWTKPARRSIEVLGVEIEDRVVTAELLQPAREFPQLYYIVLKSSTVRPDAVALLAEFPRLDQIWFESCELEPEALAPLADFPELRLAQFRDCKMSVGYLVSEGAASRTLELLYFRDVQIQPGDFRDLKYWDRLESLSLERSDIGAEALEDIVKAPMIQRLSLTETQITDEEIAAIVEADVFHVVHLDQTNVTEAHLLRLCQCRKLEHLDISGTALGPSAMEILESSPSLKSVSAYDTPLCNEISEK